MINKKKRVRMDPLQRKEKILQTALIIAATEGYESVTRTNVSLQSHCAQGLINHYFDNIENLRAVVLQTAVEKEILPILVDNLGLIKNQLTPDLKNKITNYLIT